MCTHIKPGQIEQQIEVIICQNEDCNYRFQPQCMKCAFKLCLIHFKECCKRDELQQQYEQLSKRNEQMEKQIQSLQSEFNKQTTIILSQCRQIIYQLQQFYENGLFKGLIPINLDFDIINDILNQISKEVSSKFIFLNSYIQSLQQPISCYDRIQSKIYQKHSILFEQDDHLDQSLAAINQSLSIDPQSIFSLYQKGNILLKQDQHEEALNFLQKALLLSNRSNNEVLKLQIYLSLFQESCLFKMKKFSDVIDISNKYSRIFDQKNLSMFKQIAQFNKRQYQLALSSLDEVKIHETNNKKSDKLKELCEKGQMNKIKEEQSEKYSETLKSSIKNLSQFYEKKNEANDSQIRWKDNKTIIMIFKRALQQLANIIYEVNDDANIALFEENREFILEMKNNKIELVNKPDKIKVQEIIDSMNKNQNPKNILELNHNNMNIQDIH